MHSFINRISFRSIHFAVCGGLLCFMTWGLLSPDPLASVKDSPLAVVKVVNDILIHCGVYTVFSLACFSLLRRSTDTRGRNFLLCLLMAHAVGTELLQSFIPLRTSDPVDALANMTGIALGAVCAAWITRRRLQKSAVTR